LLILKNIIKNYSVEGKVINVLKGVDLSIQQGERIALTGKSGAGKSTLLNIIATIEKPSKGEIIIDNKNPLLMSDTKMSLFRNKNIGIVFQFHHLLPEFNALENVAMPLLIARESKSAFERAKYMLEKVGLSSRIDHKPAELSGGEQQRVAIARALITSPRILLLDEPTGNLDEETAKMILDLTLFLAEEHKLTTIFVTHNKRFVDKMQKSFYLKEGVLCRQN